MTLPKKEEKGYLEIAPRDDGFAVVAGQQHAGELALLFLQYGFSCERRQDVRPGEDELRFPAGTARAQVQQVLDGYKYAKGSCLRSPAHFQPLNSFWTAAVSEPLASSMLS